MPLQLQTDGFVAIGHLPNDKSYHCLLCGRIPEKIWQDIFPVDMKDVPQQMTQQVAERTLAVTYRLCLECHESKPPAWKIRLHVLERLTYIAGRAR